MTIKAKDGAVIVARHTVDYNPKTFHEFIREEFIEVTAEELLSQIQPREYDFLPGEKIIAVDTETYYTGVHSNRMPSNVVRRWIKGRSSNYIPNDFPFCISISDGIKSYVVYDTLGNKFAEFKKLEPLLTDPGISKVYHNAGYDMHMLANANINMKGRIYDTAIMSRLLRANAFTHNLFDIAKELQRDYAVDVVLEFEQMVSMHRSLYKLQDYREIPHELMTQYTCADTWNTLLVFEQLYPRIPEQELERLFDIESEMLVVAYNMERKGIHLDLEYEHELIPELEREIDEAERAVYEMAGTRFNINSGQQLERVLIDLGYGNLIRYREPTANMLAKGLTQGNPRFDAQEMSRLDEAGVPLIKMIQQYKASLKLLNTFATKLYEMRDFDGAVHCNFNTIEAKTGRFSISAPSMQNMPRRKDDRVRGAFIAPEGYRLYDFDFKSQESIILAHYSRAEHLLNLLRSGYDAHLATASIVFNVPLEELTEAYFIDRTTATPEEEEKYQWVRSMREDSKAVGFAVTYGAGASKVASMTHKTEQEARYIIRTYMKNLPEVDVFINTANKVAKEKGRIRTILNRPVYTERGREYACVNYVIQGSAADSTKSRMVAIYKYLKANEYKTHMILQVHDSLLYNIHETEEYIIPYLKWLQTERDLFRVNVAVDVGLCHPTWKDKMDIDVTECKPPESQLEAMRNYNIWEEGLL